MLKNLKVIYRFALILSIFWIFSCQTNPQKQQVAIPNAEEVILDKKYFKIGFNTKYRMANWVEYTLEAKNLKNKAAQRKNKFYSDPELLKVGLASMTPNDLVGTEYDKGHLAPSADFTWSQEANNATFVMSNMAPQYKKLNRQAWRYLEDRVRGWACTEQELKIITGVIFDQNMKRLPNGTFIPKQFFKIILDTTPPKKSIAFIYYQEDVKDEYKNRAVTLSKILAAADLKSLPELRVIKSSYPESAVTDWQESACN